MAFSALKNAGLRGARAAFTASKMLEACSCSSSSIRSLSSYHHRSGTPLAVANAAKVKHEKYPKYHAPSDSSDDDFEPLGHRGKTDFWRRKIRTFHGILDVNKDGVISFDDFELLAKRFIELERMTSKHQAEFKHLLKDLWVKRWGEISPYNLVTVEQFLEDMHHVINDKMLVKRTHSFLPYLFRAVDSDQSGELSIDEFRTFFHCLGLNIEDANLAFRIIDSDADGKITLNEFVRIGRDFFLTENTDKISKYFWGPLVDH